MSAWAPAPPTANSTVSGRGGRSGRWSGARAASTCSALGPRKLRRGSRSARRKAVSARRMSKSGPAQVLLRQGETGELDALRGNAVELQALAHPRGRGEVEDAAGARVGGHPVAAAVRVADHAVDGARIAVQVRHVGRGEEGGKVGKMLPGPEPLDQAAPPVPAADQARGPQHLQGRPGQVPVRVEGRDGLEAVVDPEGQRPEQGHALEARHGVVEALQVGEDLPVGIRHARVVVGVDHPALGDAGQRVGGPLVAVAHVHGDQPGPGVRKLSLPFAHFVSLLSA